MASFPILHRDDYWKIWFEVFHNDKKIGAGVWHQSYKHKGNAVRRAKQQFDPPRVDYYGNVTTYKWTVSQTNPWRDNTHEQSV